MEQDLLTRLHQLRRRWRLVRTVRRSLRWGAAGAWVGLGLALVMKLFDRPYQELAGAAWAPLLFALGGALREVADDLPLLTVALETDRVATLKERLSTAVEWLLAARPLTAVSRFMINDAADHARGLRPERIFPWRLRRPLSAWILPGCLAALVLLSPAWGLWERGPAPEEIRAVGASARRIEQLARRLTNQRPAPVARPLVPRLEQLARQLREKGVDRQEAAARIQSLARQLAQERAAAGQGQGKAASGQDAQAAANRLGQLARGLGQGLAPSQARQQLEQARRQLDPNSPAAQRAAEAARALEQGDRAQAEQKLAQAAAEAQAQAQAAQAEEAAREVGEELAQEGETLDPGSGRPGPGQSSGQQVARNPGGQVPATMGKGPGDFGRGTTNREERPKEPEEQTARVIRQAQATSDWREEYQKLYASQRDEFDQATTRLKGRRQRGRVMRAQGEVLGAPTAGGTSRQQAEEVYLNSKQAAEQAVAQGQIPAEYREAVRVYFDGIDPRTSR